MKNQMLTLCLLCIISPLFLSAQWTMPLGSMKKNGLNLGITNDKEFRFGYEGLLTPRSSLNFGLGYGLQNLDPEFKTEGQRVVVTTFPRQVQTHTTWLLFFPTISTKASVPLPPTYESKSRGRYLQRSLNFYGEYKHFFGGNLRHKIQNGFYLAPGLSIGKQRFATYTFLAGRKNEIKILSTTRSTFGIPVLVGSTTATSEELVSVVDYKETEKDQVRRMFLRPHLSAGLQLPIGNLLSFDFGARVFWSSDRFDPELQPEDPSASSSIRGTANGRIAIWF